MTRGHNSGRCVNLIHVLVGLALAGLVFAQPPLLKRKLRSGCSSVPNGFHVDDFTDYFSHRMQSEAPREFDELVSNLRWAANNKRTMAPMTWGSGCSGIDSVNYWFPAIIRSVATLDETLSDIVNANADNAYGLVRHAFSSENSAKKIKFMKDNFILHDLTTAFKDVASLATKNAFTWGGCSSAAAWVWIFIAGFSCKTVSRLNQHHASNKKAVKGNKGSTAKTFWGCFDYIKKHRLALF